MGKIVRYEFMGNRTILAAQTLVLPIIAIYFPWILIALVPNLIVYLLLTVVKVEEEIERPNEFIEGFKEGRFRKQRCVGVFQKFRSLIAASRMRASGLSAALRRCGAAPAASPRSRSACPSLR
jgi:hypothetical protein